ncbi:MAG: cytochrome c [Planctomycetes bacterium]|nr:cytochrome c [Planctomycetota bacterium]
MPRKTLIILGLATILSVALGLSNTIADAQSIVPIAEDVINPDIVESAKEWPDVVWDGQGEHPGQKLYASCKACHSLDDKAGIGPGFAGLWDRVKAVEYEGTVRERLFNFVVKPGKDDQKDPYFQKTATGAMPANGLLTGGDAEVRAVLDFILRHTFGKSADESGWRNSVKLGGDFARGAKRFAAGAPSCTSCHTVGPQADMRGSNIGPNVAHTFNVAMDLGGTDETMHIEGMRELLAGEDAPKMHSYYRDDEGDCNLSEVELNSLMTFFERQLREVGTERTSNYLPVIALILAALSLMFIDGSFYGRLFAKSGPEAEDGPYEEDDHHDDDHSSSDAKEEADDSDDEKSDDNKEDKESTEDKD